MQKTVGHTNNVCFAHRVCDLADLAQMVNQSKRFAKPPLCIFRLPQSKKTAGALHTCLT